ncbi:hypothetical protein M0R72_08100 [Candidatus Pacearchaeota archaeon]|jgi:hypothetical protein|nr:hypothetical protein [Candidatus Pacearchaeota archaeon]
MSDNQNTEIEVRQVHELADSAAQLKNIDPQEMRRQMEVLKEVIKIQRDFVENVLIPGQDYGIIPGTKERSLYKQGAERLLGIHTYYAITELTTEHENWETGLFDYTYRGVVKMKGTNMVVGSYEGNCSSYEEAFRYRWLWENQIPKGTDTSKLVSKDTKTGKQFRFLNEDLANQRHNIRSKAQKRAFVAATKLATGTSALFTAPDEDERLQPPNGNDGKGVDGDGEGAGNGNTNYGEPIGRGNKSGALWHALQAAKIDEKDFNDWLKVSYGWDNKDLIGEKAFKEIIDTVKTVKTGKLPAPKPKPEKPQEGSTSPGAKLSVAQIKHLNDGLKVLGKTDAEFAEWLKVAFPHYENIKTTNDIASEEYSTIIGAFTKAVEGKLI